MDKKSKLLNVDKLNKSHNLSAKNTLLLKILTSLPSFRKIEHWHDTATIKQDFGEYLGDVLMQMHVNIEKLGKLNIPSEGGCIFVANHPTGLLEVIVWLNTILAVRKDLKMMANNWFDFLDVAQDNIISVDPFESKASYKQNIKSYKLAKSHLDNGRALMLFPAGEVAHWNWKTFGVEDPPWKKSILSLSERTGAPIIPCYSSSKNSLLFNVVGNIHPRLRTLMLAREFTSKQRKTIKIATNTNIEGSYLEKFTTDLQKMAFVRLCSEALNEKPYADHLAINDELINPVPVNLILLELINLNILSDTDEYTVYMGNGADMPHTLREIGRLREYNFRLVGEGSGNEIDLDKYDVHYQQIFLWCKHEQRILGGLRVGFGDDKLKKGIYFAEAAKFKPPFLDILNQSLDFGRLFVADDAPKDMNGILILVRNLVAYFKQSHYNYLLGQVSIPSAYPKLAIDIIVSFLFKHYCVEKFSKLVQGKTKYKLTRKHEIYISELMGVVKNSKAVNTLLDKLFQGRIEIPALLRFYLKCNTKLMNFNYDKDFGTVDALMILHRDEIPRFFK